MPPAAVSQAVTMLLLIFPAFFHSLALGAQCGAKRDEFKTTCEALTDKPKCETQFACYWIATSKCVGDLAPLMDIDYGVNRVKFFVPQYSQAAALLGRADEFAACTGVKIDFVDKEHLYTLPDVEKVKLMQGDLGKQVCVSDNSRTTCKVEEGPGKYDAYLANHEHVTEPAYNGLLEDYKSYILEGPRGLAWNDVFQSVRSLGKFGSASSAEVLGWPVDADFGQMLVRGDAIDTYKAETGVDIANGFDTWDDLAKFVQHMNGHDFDADGKPDQASCLMRCEVEQGGLFYMIYAGLMQTLGPEQGFHFDPTNMRANFENDGFKEALRIYKEITTPCPVSVSGKKCVKVRPAKTGHQIMFKDSLGNKNHPDYGWQVGKCVLSLAFDAAEVNDELTKYSNPICRGQDPAQCHVWKYPGSIRRVRLPGWRKVVDHSSGRLVSCDAKTCPFGEKGHTINRSPFISTKTYTIIIRSSAENRTKRALKDFLNYYTAPQQSVKDVATWLTRLNHFRKSHIAEAAFQKGFSAVYSRGVFDDLVQVAQDMNSANPSIDLRLRGYDDYMTYATEAMRRHFGYSVDKDYCVHAASGLENFPKLSANITQGWEHITNRFGQLEQLIRYRFSLGLAPLDQATLCKGWRAEQPDPKACVLSCAKGRHYDMKSGECTDCSAGRWSGSAGFTECLVCMAGHTCLQGTSFPTPCPPGKYSGNGSVTCTQCPQGTFSASSGSSQCIACAPGQYMDKTGGRQCKNCQQGRYATLSKSRNCTACPGTRTTISMGIASVAACICPEDFYSKTPSDACLPCGVGLICKAGSDLQNWQSVLRKDTLGVSTVPREYPRLEEGYHSFANDATFGPTFVYDCRNKKACPGGDPGTCSGGRVSVGCAKCPSGEELKDDTCLPCGGSDSNFAIVGPMIGIFICVAEGLYLLTNGKLTAKATAMFCVTCSMGLLFTFVQNLAVFTYLSVPWPSTVGSVLNAMTVFLLNPQMFISSCLATPSEVPRYVAYVVMFPVFGLYVLLRYSLARMSSKTPQKLRWVFPKVLNTLGQFYQAFFVTMTSVAISPLTCYTHPGDDSQPSLSRKSLVKYPGVLCDSTEQTIMAAFGVALLMFALAFFCTCIFVAFVVPQKGLGDEGAASAARFLFLRWRLDVWWVGIVAMFRSLVLSLAPMFFPNNVNLQLVVLIMVLVFFVSTQLIYWPWKAPLLNIIDAVINVDLIIMLCTSFAFAPKVQDNQRGIYAKLMLSNVILICVVFAGLISTAVVLFVKRSKCDPSAIAATTAPEMFLLRKHPNIPALSIEWAKMSANVKTFVDAKGYDEFGNVLSQMPIYDVMFLHKVLVIIDNLGMHEITNPKQIPRSVKQLRLSRGASFSSRVSLSSHRASVSQSRDLDTSLKRLGLTGGSSSLGCGLGIGKSCGEGSMNLADDDNDDADVGETTI